MISDWHKEDVRPYTPSIRKGIIKEMPEDFPERIEKLRLDGWSKLVCFAKAGVSEFTARRWMYQHPRLREVTDRFTMKRGPY